MTENRLLANLSTEFLSLAKETHVMAGQTLHEGHKPVNQCLFLGCPLVSFMSCTEQGSCVAVAMVGNESVLGAASLLDPHLTPYHSIAQTSGIVLKMPITGLNEWLSRDLILRSRIMSCVHVLFTQVVQTASCNRFHSAEKG